MTARPSHVPTAEALELEHLKGKLREITEAAVQFLGEQQVGLLGVPVDLSTVVARRVEQLLPGRLRRQPAAGDEMARHVHVRAGMLAVHKDLPFTLACGGKALDAQREHRVHEQAGAPRLGMRPHQRMHHLALDRIGFDGHPSSVAYIGDAPDDMRMARSVGALGVGIESSIGSRAELMAAGEVWVLATGGHKTDILNRVLHGPVDPEAPASFLTEHDNCTFFVDESAGIIGAG